MRIKINTDFLFGEDGIPAGTGFYGKPFWIDMPCRLTTGDVLPWSIFPKELQEMLNAQNSYECERICNPCFVMFQNGFGKDEIGIYQFVNIQFMSKD